MQTKAAELAGLLEGKTIFYVKIEPPNSQESIPKNPLARGSFRAGRVILSGPWSDRLYKLCVVQINLPHRVFSL
jgi:hypothetical protein